MRYAVSICSLPILIQSVIFDLQVPIQSSPGFPHMFCTLQLFAISSAILIQYDVYARCRSLAQRSSQVLLTVVLLLFLSTVLYWISTIHFALNQFTQSEQVSDTSLAFRLDKCSPTVSLLVNVRETHFYTWHAFI